MTTRLPASGVFRLTREGYPGGVRDPIAVRVTYLTTPARGLHVHALTLTDFDGSTLELPALPTPTLVRLSERIHAPTRAARPGAPTVLR